jgi:hypothetical protein
VNPGGEPERDESGLPPVDVEIPDDARELDRDMQAYYRELRAQRRHQRGLRARGTLAKDGILLPLLACCLILALITGTLLTVFTATSDQSQGHQLGPKAPGKATAPRPSASSDASGGPSGGATSAAAGSSAPASAGTPPATAQLSIVPTVLPPATIYVAGRSAISVQDLTRAALVLIPPHCNCTATVSWLISVVTGADAQTYLVFTSSGKVDAENVYWNLSSTTREQVLLALETDDQLSDNVSGTLQARGPTAILVGPTKRATYATGLSTRDSPTGLVEALTH